ncbi:hypothetical protein NLJ89_g3385 [Agrocybe chaxingu]|uniref:Aquaporin-like protein n=1 Tax=Agrocybe chaxingu TaxID=84603 RepID=A0A9W8K5E0_9AGAR|nr:hypothetical protein NLJ89_g3385 [Agrocybe chaxingu]
MAMSAPMFTMPEPDAVHNASEKSLPVLASYPTLSKRGLLVRIRDAIREPMAEFIGVAIFVIIGAGSDCQVVLSSNSRVAASPKGEYLSLNFGWAIGEGLRGFRQIIADARMEGLALAVWITLALATQRGFPWKKVPVYIFSQVMGGLVGAALVYAQYFHAIDIFEGGRHQRTQQTAGLFATYALDYMTAVSCFFAEFLGTAILAFMIMAATDKNNAAPPLYLLPLVIFLTLLGLGVALGMQTAFAFNPARDFGPRLFLSMAGYGKAVYTYRRQVPISADGTEIRPDGVSRKFNLAYGLQYWLWCPILAPVTGAQVAVAFYDLFLHKSGGANAVSDQRDIDASHGA